jgi:hypothetical protein
MSMLAIAIHLCTSQITWAVLNDFFQLGLCPTIVQLCDTYVFYDRLKAVKKVSKTFSFFIHAYIWTLIVSTYFPAFSIVPFFYDTNSELFRKYFKICAAVTIMSAILFNLSVSYLFAKVLLSVYDKSKSVGISDDRNSLQKIKSTAIRSLCHAFTSTLGQICYVSIYGYGGAVYNVLVPLGMHVWFNVPWKSHKDQARIRPEPVVLKRAAREAVAQQGLMSLFISAQRRVGEEMGEPSTSPSPSQEVLCEEVVLGKMEERPKMPTPETTGEKGENPYLVANARQWQSQAAGNTPATNSFGNVDEASLNNK